MCGITGIWNLDGSPVNGSLLDTFTDTLAHRGPDGRGIYIDHPSSFGLGHRRLAVLDPSEAGDQPMTMADKRFWITYNGEIYNFLELRDELKTLGCRFTSDTDTEVVLAAFVQWGEGCQLRFNGMWAFAIWDREERMLFVSRDRFGVKPLHYLCDGRHFAFASEMKSFLALPWFSPGFNRQALSAALASMADIEGTEDCLLAGVKRLPAGHCLTLRQGESPKIARWWNTLEHLRPTPGGFKAKIEGFYSVFMDACKIRMRSDVPLGTALSGGLDSSAILCAMSRIRSKDPDSERLARDWQRAFVATFTGTLQDERPYAEEVIRHTGAVPVYKEIESTEVFDHLDEILFQFEEVYDIPGAAWLLYRELRGEGLVVSIDGHGGDELLAGYHHYPKVAMRDALIPYPRPLSFLELRDLLKGLYPDGARPKDLGTARLLKEIYLSPITQKMAAALKKDPLLYGWARALYRCFKSQKDRPGWLRDPPGPALFSGFETDRPMLSEFDALNGRLYFDFHYTLLPTILRNFDRCSMAHGVEIRAPFMDWRVVCYSFSLPSRCKLGGGFTKRILREAMRGVLPESIRTRKDKIGFVSPLTDWLKGPLRPFFLDNLNSQTFLQSDIWNGPLIRDFVEKSLINGDYGSARRSWEYIQAMRIMELFKAKREVYLIQSARPAYDER